MNNNRGFASDNNAGIHPLMIESIQKANTGHVVAYGDDLYTLSAVESIKHHFGKEAMPFFVLTGTGANVLSLLALTQPFNAVICAETAHINTDECGAPEKFTGCKLVDIPTQDGKLTPEAIKRHLVGFGFEHHVQQKVISISQPTEMGTVYTVNEVKALSRLAKEYNLYLHMDGARLANAVVSLGCSFKEITTDAGVDVLSFGGTKNGMLFGESVIFFNEAIAGNFKYMRKQSMQLVSKMRFIGSQFQSYLDNNIWYENALHANKMAQLLYEKIKLLPEIQITQKVEANALFAIVPHYLIEPLMEKYFFYVWDEKSNEVRWMTSFDTTVEDIEGFVAILVELITREKSL
jgi:threonine aldolase